jgi:hypothetical protein
MATYGVTLNTSGVLMARVLGSALFAFSLIFYWNRNTPLTDRSQRNIILASFIYNLVDTPIVLAATLTGVMSQMGWIPVLVHIYLAITFGYFTFKSFGKPVETV